MAEAFPPPLPEQPAQADPSSNGSGEPDGQGPQPPPAEGSVEAPASQEQPEAGPAQASPFDPGQGDSRGAPASQEHSEPGLAEEPISATPEQDGGSEPEGSTTGQAQTFEQTAPRLEDISVNTTGGWYAPDEELEPPDAGDTQPVALAGNPQASRLPPPPAQPGPTAATEPPVATGDTRPLRLAPSRPVPLLPRRVDEVDLDATRVTPSAYAAPAGRRVSPLPPPPAYRPAAYPPAARRPAVPPPPALTGPTRGAGAPPVNWQRGAGCLLRLVIAGLFLVVVLAVLGASVLVFQYYRIAATLPGVDDLRQRAAQFETTRILDRNGNVLYEILDPSAGRRTYVRLDKISPYLVAATVATEDSGFYSHPGFDVTAIVRAFWQNYNSGVTVSGASTITQQLARSLLFTPEERTEQSYSRKVREAILAAEITRRYSKDEILELYLNEIYFGNLAYGVEAAAQTYFGTSADRLTLAQAAFLAGLPQAPSVYDVYTNRAVTMDRMQQVLYLMYQASTAGSCIFVSNSPQRVCVDAKVVSDATRELENYEFRSPDVQIRYPHWVNYVRALLESQFDAQTIYRSGFSVFTTLDPGLQDIAEEIVAARVAELADRDATNGALVAIRPNTGEILAMVGSADFYEEDIQGQVNMAISPRQPGSSIKPLTYVAAFEKGWTPATLIWDVPSEFPPSGDPNDTRPPFKPVNYDDRFHGPVTLRSALANSYNIPAVKTLDFVGIYDKPDTDALEGLIAFARRLGISTLNRDDYGLSLTLGGGEVPLVELTGAYAVFANGGRRVPPVAITRIVDFNGNLVYQYSPPAGDQVVRPEHAFLISSILSDNEARSPAFGPDSALNLPFQVAGKTGTTNDFRDNWTMGYVPELAVGVWVGNADYSPMQNVSGLTGAAPIWADFMEEAVQQITGGNPSPFVRPPGVVERVICAISGTEPSNACPEQRSELFAADQPPLSKSDDLWKKVLIDTWTGLAASPSCDDFTDEVRTLNVKDEWARRWLRRDSAGQAWAEEYGFDDPIQFVPERECTADDAHALLQFTDPQDGDTITSTPLEIFGQAGATGDFDSWILEFGEGDDPRDWDELKDDGSPVMEPGRLFEWDIEDMDAGTVTLRLRVRSTNDTQAEITIRLNLQVPTPTPTPTPTYTPTATPTQTPLPTETPTVTPIPTETPVPSGTPTLFTGPPDERTPSP